MIRLFREDEVRSGGWWWHSPLVAWEFLLWAFKVGYFVNDLEL